MGESLKRARRPAGGGRRGSYRRSRQTPQARPHLSSGKIQASSIAALVEAGRLAKDARIALATATGVAHR